MRIATKISLHNMTIIISANADQKLTRSIMRGLASREKPEPKKGATV